MYNIYLEYFIIFCIALFIIGCCGLISKSQNFINIFICMELMTAGCFTVFVILYKITLNYTPYIFSMLILAVNAAEVAVGLSLLLSYHRLCKNIRTEEANSLKEEYISIN
ncbi:NADH-quinone oxidoreductase subunit NuoK [Lyticum sinuosum]|uniref:NADH-quinone oxidoreductase subunit K n=1 Tax=Lyticum sinuosum TaxID=1332059 RepID=A0AAE4VLB7_9RICK|nr:NADH-quinone oxidoreductase subunit NuoK [Lyticum sinuosum]MDZ5761317.1 NADH-quinone oxidoreductase subunit K [Lyticum sinuosum]